MLHTPVNEEPDRFEAGERARIMATQKESCNNQAKTPRIKDHARKAREIAGKRRTFKKMETRTLIQGKFTEKSRKDLKGSKRQEKQENFWITKQLQMNFGPFVNASGYLQLLYTWEKTGHETADANGSEFAGTLPEICLRAKNLSEPPLADPVKNVLAFAKRNFCLQEKNEGWTTQEELYQ